MSTGYKIDQKAGLYFLTFQIVGWVDIFTRKIYRDIVIENFKYCMTHKQLEVFGYVIMSNHIHVIARSNSGKISDTIRDFKSFTSKKIQEQITQSTESRSDWLKLVFSYHAHNKPQQNNQVWTHENHAVLLYSQEFMEQKLEYIHQNPVRAGIVCQAEDYLYSSARNYADLENVMEISKVDRIWKVIS